MVKRMPPATRLRIGVPVASELGKGKHCDQDATQFEDRELAMRAAGARVTNEPVDAEFFTGRSAYLCDPGGNYFEIVWADMPNNPVVIAARRAAGL